MDEDDALANEDNTAAPSRSALKRDALARRELGARLTQLSPELLDGLRLPEGLRAALHEFSRLKARGAKRRQLQFIGGLMRDLDPTPIQQLIDELSGQSAQARYQLHQLEGWRERLLTQPQALTEFIDSYPQVDRQMLRALVNKARRGAQADAREAERSRSARALFRFLRETLIADQDA